MVDPSEIVDNLVDLLREIPDLVELVGGDQERIFAYHDRYPTHTSLDQAIYQLPSPRIMVAWRSTGPGSFAGGEAWKHEIVLILRAGQEEGADSPQGYYQLFRQITRGIPTGLAVPLIYATVHASCQPMDTPSIRRLPDAAGVDYCEVTMIFTEIGDE